MRFCTVTATIYWYSAVGNWASQRYRSPGRAEERTKTAISRYLALAATCQKGAICHKGVVVARLFETLTLFLSLRLWASIFFKSQKSLHFARVLSSLSYSRFNPFGTWNCLSSHPSMTPPRFEELEKAAPRVPLAQHVPGGQCAGYAWCASWCLLLGRRRWQSQLPSQSKTTPPRTNLANSRPKPLTATHIP